MVAGSEPGKENYTITPSKVGSNDLQLYNFLGILMGVAIRTNTVISIYLPNIVWKLLIGQRIVYEDLVELDDGFITELKALASCESAEKFEEEFGDRNFTVD